MSVTVSVGVSGVSTLKPFLRGNPLPEERNVTSWITGRCGQEREELMLASLAFALACPQAAVRKRDRVMRGGRREAVTLGKFWSLVLSPHLPWPARIEIQGGTKLGNVRPFVCFEGGIWTTSAKLRMSVSNHRPPLSQRVTDMGCVVGVN